MSVLKKVLFYVAAFVGGLVVAFSLIALSPSTAFLGLLMPFVALLVAWFFDRRRHKPKTLVERDGEGVSKIDPPVASVPAEPKPSLGLADEINRGKQRLWASAAALVVVIAGICAWAYIDQEQNRADLIHALLEMRAQEILGADYTVRRVEFPAGTQAYDYPVAVRVVETRTGDNDLFTLLVRGDCNSGCRIGLDPKDALRLMAKRTQ